MTLALLGSATVALGVGVAAAVGAIVGAVAGAGRRRRASPVQVADPTDEAIAGWPASGPPRRVARPELARRSSTSLPLGVVVMSRRRRACSYRNAHGAASAPARHIGLLLDDAVRRCVATRARRDDDSTPDRSSCTGRRELAVVIAAEPLPDGRRCRHHRGRERAPPARCRAHRLRRQHLPRAEDAGRRARRARRGAGRRERPGGRAAGGRADGRRSAPRDRARSTT